MTRPRPVRTLDAIKAAARLDAARVAEIEARAPKGAESYMAPRVVGEPVYFGRRS